MASLNQRSGVLGKRLAAHLLRRATYKVTPARIDDFATRTAVEAVDELFLPTTPLYPNGPISWESGNPIFSPTDIGGGENEALGFSVTYATAFWRIYESIADNSVQWKIIDWFTTLFVLKGNQNYYYYFFRLLKSLAFSDLKTLAVKATLDNQMLNYLNNNSNNKYSPNENYAREFLELFTILRGETIGVGNYTNYTEADISTAARVLTGFRNSDTSVDSDTGVIRGYADYNLHDTDDKTFSSAFVSSEFPTATITGANSSNDMFRELEDFVSMIFAQLETAKSYVRKMYRFFVRDTISTEIENDIITPLANQLKNNGYQHGLILQTLLKSVHFYDEDDGDNTNEIVGGKMKSPLEMFMTSINLLNIENSDITDPNPDIEDIFRNRAYAVLSEHFTVMGYDTLGPNTVEGFPGFYDAPGYSKNWFSANFIYERFTFGVSFKRGRVRNGGSVLPYQCNMVEWVVNNVDDAPPGENPLNPQGASNASKLLDDMLTYLLAEMPTGERYIYFQKQLLGGLSPINWFFSWKEYLATNDDTNVRVGIENLYDKIMSSPEFQTF